MHAQNMICGLSCASLWPCTCPTLRALGPAQVGRCPPGLAITLDKSEPTGPALGLAQQSHGNTCNDQLIPKNAKVHMGSLWVAVSHTTCYKQLHGNPCEVEVDRLRMCPLSMGVSHVAKIMHVYWNRASVQNPSQTSDVPSLYNRPPKLTENPGVNLICQEAPCLASTGTPEQIVTIKHVSNDMRFNCVPCPTLVWRQLENMCALTHNSTLELALVVRHNLWNYGQQNARNDVY